MSQPWPPDPLDSASESDPASLSPRTDLLSPPFDHVHLDDLPRRLPRGPSLRFRRERERAYSTASPHDLLDKLITEEHESKQTHKILYSALDRIEQQTRRADAAEGRIEETIQRARAINEARVTAQQQAVRAQEELKLYKMQLDNAQKEILRAQEVLKAIEAQRDEAEAAAVSARSKARRLNEERLIELAREEGRRLGFEEGVRRGRRMGNREAYSRRDEIATATVDRLLEDRDEPEEIEVLEEPRPIPPPSTSRVTPQVHRIETPISSSLENQRPRSRSGHDSSESTLGPRRGPDPGMPVPPTPTASARPPSISQPWATDTPYSRPASVQSVRHAEFHVPPDNYIPTADANHSISLPPPHEMQRSPTPSQRTLGPSSERGRPRDYIYDNNYPLPRRGSPDESLASTKQSAASSISQLDIVGLPSGSKQRRDRQHGLSVIHEDASMRSESEAGRRSFREMPSNDTLRKRSKQQLADELRYSDPTTAEQWRQQADSSRAQPPPEGPPRPRPSHITVPTPLSPPRVLQDPDARLRRTPSERQGRPETRSDYRDHRRPHSSDSSVPEINVEPPSGPPSDAPSRGRGHARGLLSPDHANMPLPMPGPTTLDGQFSAGHGPSQAPVIPQHTGGSAPPQRYAVPSAPSSERSRSPISFYAASPVPAGVTYPAPPISRSATFSGYAQSAGSNPSVTSEGRGRRRRDSLGASAGMTPAARAKPIPQTAGSTDSLGLGGGASKRPSSGSYARYDPGVYNDPAFFASSASLVDSVTGGSTRAGRVSSSHGSPGYGYAALRAHS